MLRFDGRNGERRFADRSFAEHGVGHAVAIDRDFAAVSGQGARQPHLVQRHGQQDEAADDEQDGRGRGAEDPESADPESERIDERYDDHAGGDGEHCELVLDRGCRCVVEGLHGV